MPDGRILRIDHGRDRIYLIRRGRTYSAPLNEVDPKARVPSALVEFDLNRRDGRETATNVRLRAGTRTNRRQRRFGDLVGAKRPGAKIDTAAHRDYGIDSTTPPLPVVRAWLEAMRAHDFDGATSLYLPGARYSSAAGPVDDLIAGEGRRFIRATLERCPIQGPDCQVLDLSGLDTAGPAAVRLEVEAHGEGHVVYFAIERGTITEQWVDTEPDGLGVVESKAEEGWDTVVVARGRVPDRAKQYARDKLAHVAERVGQPVRFARVKMTRAESPGFDRPAMVEASLEFDHLHVRAHGSANTFAEALDQVAQRLWVRIEHQRERRDRRTAALPAVPGSWRHGNLARPATPYFERPDTEREIVRHKSFAAGELTVDEAAWDMAALDYDFFLFVDLDTGQDSLLEMADEPSNTVAGSLRLRQLKPAGDQLGPMVNEVELIEAPVPNMTVDEAVTMLNTGGQRRLFFHNVDTGRGNVVYRRYDGHYGLITPPDDEPMLVQEGDRDG